MYVHVRKDSFRTLGAFQHHFLLQPWTSENTDDQSQVVLQTLYLHSALTCFTYSTPGLHSLTFNCLAAENRQLNSKPPTNGNDIWNLSSHIIFRKKNNTNNLTSLLSLRSGDFYITSVVSFWLCKDCASALTLQTLTVQMKKGMVDRGIGTVHLKCFEKCQNGFFSFQEPRI